MRGAAAAAAVEGVAAAGSADIKVQVKMPAAAEAPPQAPPQARTQATLTSIGAEPQTQLILFGGYALNIGTVNDTWRCTVSVDASSMPVAAWEKLESTGEAPRRRRPRRPPARRPPR